MEFSVINSFLAPIGLIIAGILIRFSKREELASFRKRWYIFVILGVLLLVLRLYN